MPSFSHPTKVTNSLFPIGTLDAVIPARSTVNR
jgi:hypothetical protein